MSHKAVVTSIKTKKHPNADRVQLAITKYGHYQVVVGLNQKDGDLGIFFQPDLQLSSTFAESNDLIGYTDDKGIRRGGYFSKNRRVRVQNFRGERSEGFWIPISSLSNISGVSEHDVSKLEDGSNINSINNVLICEKYITPATKQSQKNKQKKIRKENDFFRKHVTTTQFRDEGQTIKKGSIITVSEKIHGTSARVGKVLEDVTVDMSFFQKLWRRVKNKPSLEHRLLIGSRNVILNNTDKKDYYEGDNFRETSAESFSHLLNDSEIVYYEIAGFTHSGKAIMSTSALTDKKDKQIKRLNDRYGDFMNYSYGNSEKQCSAHVYRIVNILADGRQQDLPYHQMIKRCEELGLSPIPELISPFIYDGDLDKLTNLVVDDMLLEGSSTLDSRHIREGVVLRIEDERGVSFMKVKSYTFCMLEGILKSFIGYVDPEDIA